MNVAAQPEARFEPDSIHSPSETRDGRRGVARLVSMVAGIAYAALSRVAPSRDDDAMLQRLRNRPSLLDGGPPRDGSQPYAGVERFGG